MIADSEWVKSCSSLRIMKPLLEKVYWVDQKGSKGSVNKNEENSDIQMKETLRRREIHMVPRVRVDVW